MRRLLGVGLALCTSGCVRWHEFHSVQPYAGKVVQAPLPALSSSAPLVVILAGSEGTEIFDLLAPYAILAATGRLDVRVIARDTAAVPAWRGIAVRPHLTLTQLDSSGRVPAAIVVPNFTDADSPRLEAWLARQVRAGSMLLAVCEGARIAARAGLLEGRIATSHSAALGALMKEYPSVRWTRGPRWVADGPVTTTAGVSASTEGSLHLVERLLGKNVRNEVMAALRYPHAEPLATFAATGIGVGDKWRLGTRALFGGTGRVVAVLEDGVDDFALAATLDTWARLFPRSLRTVTEGDHWITTRHGLVIGPTARWETLAAADDVVMFGHPTDAARAAIAGTARWSTIPVDRYPFATLRPLIAGRFGAATANTVFRTMDLPVDAPLR